MERSPRVCGASASIPTPIFVRRHLSVVCFALSINETFAIIVLLNTCAASILLIHCVLMVYNLTLVCYESTASSACLNHNRKTKGALVGFVWVTAGFSFVSFVDPISVGQPSNPPFVMVVFTPLFGVCSVDLHGSTAASPVAGSVGLSTPVADAVPPPQAGSMQS